MKNPWEELKESFDSLEFVLSSEKKVIDEFNLNSSDKFKIHTEIMPAPFMGNVHTARIVILMLNPGYDEDEFENNYYSEYKEYWQNEILHIKSIENLPLFCLDERYIKYSPYWSEKLKPIISIVGKEKVANNICKIQYFPYHSKKFKKIPKKIIESGGFEKFLPSQEYNIELVKKAMERNAIIIIPRSKNLWEDAIPKLKTYQNKYLTNSYLNITLSEKNLETGFNKIIETLNQN